MSLKVLLSFLLASFLSTSFVCTSMFVGFGWVIGEMWGWSHTRGTWGLDGSWGEEGTVFVGHSVKAECCLCTFLCFFFFRIMRLMF